MGILENDIIQLESVQSYASQAAANVWVMKIEAVTGSPTYTQLAEGFESELLPLINSLQVVSVLNVEVNMINLTNTLDEASYALSGGGDVSGEGLPPQAAYGFKLVRSTRAIKRSGGKRFVGIPEEYQQFGTVVGAALAKLDVLAAGIEDGFAFGDGGSNQALAKIGIASRDPVGLYDPESWQALSGVVARTTVRPQNSRVRPV